MDQDQSVINQANTTTPPVTPIKKFPTKILISILIGGCIFILSLLTFFYLNRTGSSPDNARNENSENSENHTKGYVEGEVLVMFEDALTIEEIQAFLSTHNLELTKTGDFGLRRGPLNLTFLNRTEFSTSETVKMYLSLRESPYVNEIRVSNHTAQVVGKEGPMVGSISPTFPVFIASITSDEQTFLQDLTQRDASFSAMPKDLISDFYPATGERKEVNVEDKYTNSTHFYDLLQPNQVYLVYGNNENLNQITRMINTNREKIKSIKYYQQPNLVRDDSSIKIEFDESIPDQEISNIFTQYGLENITGFSRLNMVVLKVPIGKEEEYIKELEHLPEVNTVMKNMVMPAPQTF